MVVMVSAKFSRCFITQLPSAKHDLQVLARFGSLVPLLGRGYFPDDVEIYTREILASCDKMLIDFNPNTDYIVPLGDSCVVSTIAIWLERHGLLPATFLKYDKKLKGYYTIQIGEKI
tara:strand:- start:203 stop:553 length:351 start_codon:yes stop_codon:yes gene_type:complete